MQAFTRSESGKFASTYKPSIEKLLQSFKQSNLKLFPESVAALIESYGSFLSKYRIDQRAARGDISAEVRQAEPRERVQAALQLYDEYIHTARTPAEVACMRLALLRTLLRQGFRRDAGELFERVVADGAVVDRRLWTAMLTNDAFISFKAAAELAGKMEAAGYEITAEEVYNLTKAFCFDEYGQRRRGQREREPASVAQWLQEYCSTRGIVPSQRVLGLAAFNAGKFGDWAEVRRLRALTWRHHPGSTPNWMVKLQLMEKRNTAPQADQ